MYYKLHGATKDYIWGGNRLADYGYPGDRIAEAWVLSLHPDGMASIDGRPANEVLTRADWGSNCDRFEMFPVLVKLIDAKSDLSVQVHPSDAYALANEGQYGKTEMWYVVDAEPGAGLYIGCKKAMDKSEFADRIAAGTLTDALNFAAVKPGDCYFIPSGTVHAIGKGCLIAEVQQNSNLTYRVYDYGRLGADGKPRALHIDKAIAVADLTVYQPPVVTDALAECTYFRVRELRADAPTTVGEASSFVSALFLTDGCIDGDAVAKGDSCFIPAGRSAALTGRVLLTSVPKD